MYTYVDDLLVKFQIYFSQSLIENYFTVIRPTGAFIGNWTLNIIKVKYIIVFV